MADRLRLHIVTPASTASVEGVEMVTLPAVGGQIGVCPHHVPLLTRIAPGEIIVRRNERDEFFAVGEGLVEITGDSVAIVTDMAVAARDIDEARAEEARQRAAARLREKITDEELATVNASLARSLAQLHVKRHRRV
jgi:F-type H+-transporting ATPase subunit epsilon